MMGGRRHDKGTLKMRGDVALAMKESYFKNQINNGGQVTRSARNLTYIFDGDGDVDGSDLAVFAADFGRTDCP